MPTIPGFSSLAALPEERVTDKISRKWVAGERGMLVWWRMKAGAQFSPHCHPHEQIVWVIKGKMNFRMGKERRVMAAGDVAVIPGGVEHEGSYPEDSEVIDVFAPPREDFFAASPPPYMREG